MFSLLFGTLLFISYASELSALEDQSLSQVICGRIWSQLSPGPLAAQLTMYIGWLRAGTMGATLVDMPTVLIGIVTLAALMASEKVPEPMVILSASAVGVLLHGTVG